MGRADRLFQIVDQLRRRRFMTAAQLAETFEVTPRTIYRDVLELNASGVPILGEAGVGYRLDPTYKLPPLMFNDDEIETLVIALRMVESWGDSGLKSAARSILDKVNAVIPAAGREQLNATALFSLSFGKGDAAALHLGSFRQAVNQRRKVLFSYEDAQNSSTERTVRPLGLYFMGNTWMLAAYCELRSDFRNFRLDRVVSLTVTDDAFVLESPCTLDDYVASMRAEY